ncbi:MAG TPA: biopolymer transporter ExbD [Desulfohalobiaceae bacterium]|nr:biopolymer transporter ExbD [Desulfohalobiaceae bacterium]
MQSIRYTRKRSRESVQLNIAPLIDMIFILLIFFLVTTSFVKESGVDVQRPVAKTAQKKDKTNMVIGITAENMIYIEGKPIDKRAVRSHMERFLMQNPNGSVVIAADEESKSGLVIQVLDACRLAGIKKISVAARQPQS